MKFFHPDADVFVPAGDLAPEAALARATHLCIAAHQDDIEIMAYHGIAECFGRPDRGFAGVVVNDGAGSPRAGAYAQYSDTQMKAARREEQRRAASLGGYCIQLQLAHPGAVVRDPHAAAVAADLAAILAHARPEVVYLHQPCDKHDTHLAVLAHSLAALRALPPERRPARVLGCEVWRDLDWLDDADKQALDVSARPALAHELIAVFESQVAGGKRYDLATAGRRLANATFHTAHATDRAAALTWAMDLTPLVLDPTLGVRDYAAQFVERFRRDVDERLAKIF